MPFSKMIRNLKINGFNSLSKGHKLRLKVVMHPLTSAVRSPRHVDHCVLSNMVYTARYRRAKIMSLSTNKQTNKDHTDYQVGLAIIICFADSKKYTQPSNINIGNEYALLFWYQTKMSHKHIDHFMHLKGTIIHMTLQL